MSTPMTIEQSKPAVASSALLCGCGYDLRVSGHCGCGKYFSICLGCHNQKRGRLRAIRRVRMCPPCYDEHYGRSLHPAGSANLEEENKLLKEQLAASRWNANNLCQQRNRLRTFVEEKHGRAKMLEVISPNEKADLPPTGARQPRSGTEGAIGG